MPISRDVLRGLLQQAGVKKLRDTGNGFQGLCMFHDNKRTPAWGMNLDGLWNCMNPACGEKGNLVTFLVRVLNMTYDQAIQYQPAEVASPDIATKRLPAYDKRTEAFVEPDEFLPDARLDLYRSCPRYMLGRGYPIEFLRDYEIGFDSEARWPDRPRKDDPGRPAVTFPVRDHRTGRLIGFTRRSVESDAWPPYAHDFDKTRTLYLLHRLSPGPVLVTEGPCDALTARLRALDCPLIDDAIRRALSNAVATLGGKWSPEYIAMLKATGRDVWLGFDWQAWKDGELVADIAGRAATERWIAELLAAGCSRVFVLRGFETDLGAMDVEQVDSLSYSPYWRRHASRSLVR